MPDHPAPSGRVVVTGIGVVTPIGTGVETFWANCLAGKNGVRKITLDDVSPFTTQIAAEVPDFEPTDWLDKKEARRIDRVITFAVASARMAMADSGIVLTEELRDNFGVYIGSGIGGLNVMSEQTKVLYQRGPDRVSPFWVPYMIANMPGGIVAIQFGLHGPNMATVTACSTGANTIGEAAHAIKRGDATMMLAGGTEASICDIGIAAFCAARAMSTRNDSPEHASRPFDRDRDGFVMGEGSGVVVLEDYDHAIARGAKIYAEIVGYGMTADAHHITAIAADAKQPARAITRAVASAGITVEDIGYVNAHGTSTPIGDPTETKALKLALGDHAYSVAVSSTKSMIGHTLGAAGAIETIVCILALRDGIMPPTRNLDNPDDACDLDYIPHVARKKELKYALNNSFGFGGHNVSLVLKKHV